MREGILSYGNDFNDEQFIIILRKCYIAPHPVRLVMIIAI